MARMYIESEHGKIVLATVHEDMLRSSKTNFTTRIAFKNYAIMRHYFERMREHFGPFDGLRGGLNYTKAGTPHKLPWGGPESQWDHHVLKWQQELVAAKVITVQEILSPASIGMIMRWVITKQHFDALWKVGRATSARRYATNAGWLLQMDLVELEKLNYAIPIDYSLVENKPEAEPGMSPDDEVVI